MKPEKNESLTLRETNFKGNSKSSLEYIRIDYRVNSDVLECQIMKLCYFVILFKPYMLSNSI